MKITRSDSNTTATETYRQSDKQASARIKAPAVGEEQRWHKAPATGDGTKVRPEQSLQQASTRSLAYACRVYEKIAENDASKGEAFIATLVENLFSIQPRKRRDALHIATDNALKFLVKSELLTAGQAEVCHDAGVKTAHAVEAKAIRNKRSTSSPAAAHEAYVPGRILSNVPEGFLWKPVSESDGKLAILLPPNLSNRGAAVEILDSTGNVLAKGRSAGNGNGGRDHFRFNSTGSSYPEGAVVRIITPGEAPRLIVIQNTANRTEGR